MQEQGLYGSHQLVVSLWINSGQSVTIGQQLGRGDRVVDGTGLENRRGATHRGFESLPLRQEKESPFGLSFSWRGFGAVQ